MIYILEFFDFLKKNKPKKDWRSEFDEVYKYYNSIKVNPSKDYHFFNVGIKSKDSFDVALDQIHIGFSNRNGELEVTNYKEIDFDNFRGRTGEESEPGHYKDITQNEFNEYLKKTQEMSDFLDEKSEEKFNKSGTTISDDGIELGFDESDTAIDEMNFHLQKEFDKYIDKEYEFEIQYHLWSEESKNEKITERVKLPILDIRIEFAGGRFYSEIETEGVQGEKCKLWLEGRKYQYVDLEGKRPDYGEVITMDKVKKELTRKQERESKNTRYPYIISYKTTPSKYDSIEFINTITELLEHLNDEIKKREA
jgi:hypothetical protein